MSGRELVHGEVAEGGSETILVVEDDAVRARR